MLPCGRRIMAEKAVSFILGQEAWQSCEKRVRDWDDRELDCVAKVDVLAKFDRWSWWEAAVVIPIIMKRAADPKKSARVEEMCATACAVQV